MGTDVEFYSTVWRRLVRSDFTVQKLADRVRADGGIDIENLTHSQVLDLIRGTYSGPWSEPAFTFSEMLASYSSPGGIQTEDQIVGWMVAAFALADAVRHGACDWERHLGHFIDAFVAIRDRLETEEALHVFRRVFA